MLEVAARAGTYAEFLRELAKVCVRHDVVGKIVAHLPIVSTVNQDVTPAETAYLDTAGHTDAQNEAINAVLQRFGPHLLMDVYAVGNGEMAKWEISVEQAVAVLSSREQIAEKIE